MLPIMARGLVNTFSASLRLAGPLSRALRRAAPSLMAAAGDLLRRPKDQPVTRFNAVISPHRVFETRRFTLDEFRAIRALATGATLNDAVLAVCGGALRRYLDEVDELPEESLTAMAPFFIRGADADASSTADHKADLTLLHVQLGTHIADPLRRLEAICEQTASSEVLARAVGARELIDVAQHAPAATLALAGKLMGRAAAGLGWRAPLANCAITSVPGPSVPLYLCGARLNYFSAIMPISDGMGLVFAVTSYDGQIVISPTSCRELMPDPERFALCLRDSFQEYLAAASTAAAPRKAPALRRPRSDASSSGRPRQANPAA